MTAARRGARRRRAAAAAPGPAGAAALAARCGAAIGLAGGFAVWSLRVRLWDASYHFGGLGSASHVFAACIAAGLLWIGCSALGAAVGAIVGLFLSGSPAAQGPLRLGAAASAGVYLLALRGAWGYAGNPPDERGVYSGGAGPPAPLPAEALLIPVLLAAAAAAAILWHGRRAQRDEAPGAAGAEASMRGIVLFHACFSLAAAHLTVQLPYYLGAWEPFLAGLRDLALLLPGT